MSFPSFSNFFAPMQIENKEPPSIVEKLKSECPHFPMYLKKFSTPYFIYANDVEFQGVSYTIYARINQSSVSNLNFFNCDLPSVTIKDIPYGDYGFKKAVDTFKF